MKTLLPYFKKTTSLLILMLFMAFVQKSFGQTVAANYSFAASSGSYIDVSSSIVAPKSTALVSTTWDDGIFNVTLPFNFTFNSTSYSSINVSENGFITFGSTAPTSGTFTPISTSTGYAGAISAFGRDLFSRSSTFNARWTSGSNVLTYLSGTLPAIGTVLSSSTSGIPSGAIVVATTGSSVTINANATASHTTGSNSVSIYSGISTQTVGTSPNRKFIIQWSWSDAPSTNGNSSATGSNINFEIVLNETSNIINVVYAAGNDNSTNFSDDAQVGLRGASNADYNNIKGTSWSAPSTGTSNASVMTVSGTSSFPASGQTYTWTPNPNLAVSTTTLAAFSNTVAGSSSASQNFTLSGSNLTGYPANITVNAPSTDFQVSNDNSTWGATTTVAYTSATLAATTVYVRFTPQSTGAKSGNVTFTGSGDPSPPTVAVSGTGVAGAFAKLLLLLPGETATPGVAPGKSGTPTAQTAGTAFTVTVNAVDANWNFVNTATDNINIASTDGSGVMPANAVLVAGTKNFNVTLKTAGSQTVTASDVTSPSKTANSSTVTVNAATASVISINAGNSQSATVGTSVATAPSVKVTDAYGNVISGAAVTFTVLTGNGSITGGSTTTNASGIATIGSWTLGNVAGSNTLKAAITSSNVTFSATGTAGAFNKLLVLLPGESIAPGTATGKTGTATAQTAGTAFNVTVDGVDQYWNIVSSAADAIAITSTDAQNVLPANSNLVSGTKIFSITLKTSGTQTVTATDVTNGGITASSSSVTVNPGALASLTMSTIASPQPVDSTFTSSVTITGKDAYGNLVNGGSLAITTTAGSVTPTPISLGSGGTVTVNNFKVTQSGTAKTITATSGLIFVTSNPFDVSTFNSSATGDYFQSNADNVDWALVSSWQGSHDGINWYTATAYPTSTATSILVQSIHTINVSSSVSCSALTINGKVNVNASGNLSNTGSITSTASTLLINAGGTYTHNQDGGNIPTAKWDVASTCYISGIGSNAPSNLSQTFGNYTWDCGGQTDDVPAPLPSTIKGNLNIKNSNGHYITLPSTVTVSGNFVMNGGVLGIVCNTSFFGSGSQTGTLNIAGNFTMTGGTLEAVAGNAVFSAPSATFNINFNGTTTQTFLKTGGSITETNGASFTNTSYGNNNFIISNHAIVDFGTSQLDGASNFTLSSGGTIITANVNGLTQTATGSSAGTIIGTTATGSVGARSYSSAASYIFNGTSAQNTGVFTTTSTANTVANLTINNAAGVTLSQPLSVTGVLTLTSGLLTTTSTNLLSMASGSSVSLAVSDYTNTSYVNGPIQKTGTTAFTFPVGKSGTGYVPISISSTTASQTFRAEYIHSSASALGSIASGSPLQRVSNCDYWNLNLYNSSGTQISSLASGTIAVTLYWNQNNSCNVIHDLSSLAIGHFGTTWDVIGLGAYTTSGSTTNGSITYAGATNFSPFALATTNGVNNPLPITLDYFTATKQVGYNKLTWKVECTSSSSSFDVERSYDGSNFEAINTVKVSSATDCSLPFVYNDYSSNGNKVYYRIKMVDVDDNAKYSNIELISNNANAIELMSIQPNPVYGDANLKVSASGVQNIELAIIGIDGKQMQHRAIQVQQGTNTVQLNTSGLAKGIYFVKGIFENGQTNIIKFIKQ